MHDSITEPLINISWTLPMVFLTFLAFFIIMRKLFFKKIHDHMRAREQKVIDAFDNAEQVNKVADERLLEYNDKLSTMEEESRTILRESKEKADARAEEIVAAAHQEADAIKDKARREIERERAMAIEDMKEQVALLAVYAAEKIIQKQLDGTEQQAIILGAIEEVGKSQWQN